MDNSNYIQNYDLLDGCDHVLDTHFSFKYFINDECFDITTEQMECPAQTVLPDILIDCEHHTISNPASEIEMELDQNMEPEKTENNQTAAQTATKVPEHTYTECVSNSLDNHVQPAGIAVAESSTIRMTTNLDPVKRTMNEVQVVLVDTAFMVQSLNDITNYETVDQSVWRNYPKDHRGKCQIMFPSAGYRYEPELYLDYFGNDQFAYRFSNPNRIIGRPKGLLTSNRPKPPKHLCLECNETFANSSTARRHSRNAHTKREPIIKSSFYVRLDR